MTDLDTVWINGRWPLALLPHRARRPEWPWWEAHRLAVTHWLVTEYLPIEDGRRPVVYDVGAEEGDFSALYGTWGADVVLIEPNPHAWPQIARHWRANNDHPPAGFYAGLLSDITDAATLPAESPESSPLWPVHITNPVRPDHGFIHLDEGAGHYPTARLEDVRHRWPPPDLIVLDVEGSELRVLQGAEATLRRWRPHVIVSVHPDFMRDRYQNSPLELYGLMADAGYRPRQVCSDHETHVWFHPMESAPDWF